MTLDKFLNEFISARKSKGLSVEDTAKLMNISASTIKLCENGVASPSAEFIVKAEKLFNMRAASKDNFQNVFTQGYFGNRIPLITEYDLINDCCERVIYHMELPHLERYGENNLFALNYSGDDIGEMGILKGSILVFAHCTKVSRDGVYAIVKRDALSIKSAAITNGEIRLETLDGKKRTPSFCKTSKASGRLVCCINNYK